MAIYERDVFNLALFNMPLGKWKDRSAGDIIYQIDSKKLDLKTRVSGVGSVVEKIMVIDENQIKIDYQIRTNSWDNERPPLHFYDRESCTFTNEQINEVLKLGCLPGKKNQIKWKI